MPSGSTKLRQFLGQDTTTCGGTAVAAGVLVRVARKRGGRRLKESAAIDETSPGESKAAFQQQLRNGTRMEKATPKRSDGPPGAESLAAMDRASLQPIAGAARAIRRRLSLKDEFLLATLPTLIVLAVLALVEALSQQRVLFALLASSAFLIYLDPRHGANSVRSLVLSHLTGSLAGAWMDATLGAGYDAAGAAMVMTIVLMITADVVHPPAVGTALSFAFRPSDVRALTLFLLCLVMIAILVVLQRGMLRLLARLTARRE